jgi:hypothetical protein
MKLLFIVTSDPRRSPLPAEAVRICAGVAVWGRVRVALWLEGPALLSLEESSDDLLDATLFGQHLPAFCQAGGRVVAPRGDPYLAEIIHPRVRPELVDREDLARWVANHDSVARF